MSMLPLATTITEAYEAASSTVNGASAQPFHVARAQAMRAFLHIGIPTTRHEEWKYTNVMPLAAKSWQHKPSAWLGSAIARPSVQLPGLQDAIRITIHNGNITLPSQSLPEGLTIGPLSSAAVIDVNEADMCTNPIAAAALALASEGVVIEVADNVQCAIPIHVSITGDSAQQGLLTTTRVVIRAGRFSKLDVIESHHTHGGADILDLGLCSADVGEGANVSYTKIINDAKQLHHIGQLSATVAHAGIFASHSINLNAGFVRNDVQIKLAGELSQGFLYGVSILDDSQYVDNHTVVDHMVPHCHSEELYKGVYNGSSTGVFNGKIYVRPQAQKTTAYQSSHSLLLSGKAQVNAKPQLEIWADDVKCSHGATTGQLNEDAVFYLQARGIDRAKATSLLTYAFAAEVLVKLPHEGLRGYLMERLAEKLGAESL